MSVLLSEPHHRWPCRSLHRDIAKRPSCNHCAARLCKGLLIKKDREWHLWFGDELDSRRLQLHDSTVHTPFLSSLVNLFAHTEPSLNYSLHDHASIGRKPGSSSSSSLSESLYSSESLSSSSCSISFTALFFPQNTPAKNAAASKAARIAASTTTPKSMCEQTTNQMSRLYQSSPTSKSWKFRGANLYPFPL